jgi:hypothetical protein
MKDVELTANLLLSLELGPKGFSQDELDTAFSLREEGWEDGAEFEARFIKIFEYIRELGALPNGSPLSKTRLRNQADFYSLFTSIDRLMQAGKLPPVGDAAQSISTFLNSVDDDGARAADPTADSYFSAARSNSNDTGARQLRTDIMSAVIAGTPYVRRT